MSTRAVLSLLLLATCAVAAPDEDRLGKAAGYPVGTAGTWFYDEAVRVGSFTHQAEIPGLYRGLRLQRDAARLRAPGHRARQRRRASR